MIKKENASLVTIESINIIEGDYQTISLKFKDGDEIIEKIVTPSILLWSILENEKNSISIDAKTGVCNMNEQVQ